MDKLAGKYIILSIYILGLLVVLQIGGVKFPCLLLSMFNIAYAILNWKTLCRDKSQIILYSVLYIVLVLTYQAFTPPLNEIYNPYFPLFYHVFITTGISFWILGYKGYDILNKFNKYIIATIVIAALIYSILTIHTLGGLAYLRRDTNLYNFFYQVLPYLLLLMSSALFILIKPIRMVIIILFIIVVLFSTKRGPLVAMGLGFAAVLFLQGKIKIKLLVGIVVVAIAGYFLINMLFESFLIEWLDRWLQNDDVSSGRGDIWEIVLSDYFSHDLISIIFGNGYESSHMLMFRRFSGAMGAHNDFLDILYNFGIVGFVIFVNLVVRWIKITFTAVKKKFFYKDMMVYLIVCFLIGSIISSNLNRFSTIYFSSFFYYFAGKMARNGNLRRKRVNN